MREEHKVKELLQDADDEMRQCWYDDDHKEGLKEYQKPLESYVVTDGNAYKGQLIYPKSPMQDY